jgi:Ca-activated chloride channel family protein
MFGLPATWQVRLRRLPDFLRAVVWLLLVVALARPQLGNTQEFIRGEGVEIALALDISGSMSAADFGEQNRLEAAKTVIAEFVEGRAFDRIGLVVFARQAFHHVPPTLDYDILIQLLNEVSLGSSLGLEEGTAIGLGIAAAANLLRHSEAPSKVIILLTDGAHNAEGISPIDAALRVSMLGMRVYTIGIGSIPDEAVAVVDGIQFVEDALDEATLREIAEIANGQYFRAVDLADLRAVYDQINVLEKSDVERQIFVNWQDQGAAILLPASIVLLVAERILRLTLLRTLP